VQKNILIMEKTLKQQVIENVGTLPNDASLDDILEEIEDILDIMAVEEAWAEQGDEPLIPWEQVKKELDAKKHA
jgi:predicted RND superfamily exporter protein